MTSKITLRALAATSILASLLLAGCGQKSKIQATLDRAEDYYQEGKLEEAKVEFLNLRSRDPKSAKAHARLGEIWLRQGSPYQAVPFLLAAQELAPDNAEVCVHLAEVSLMLGAKVDARRYALEAIGKDSPPDRVSPLLAETTTTEAMITETQEVLKKSATGAAAALAAAVLEGKRGEQEKAEVELRRALELAPEWSKTHLAMAYFLTSKKELEAAETHHRKASELAPLRSKENVALAEFLIRSGKLEEARSQLEALTESAPDYLPGWLVLAQIAMSERDFPGAKQILANVLARDPIQHEARLLQSQIQMAEGEAEEVLENLKELKKVYPFWPIVEFRLAVAYLMNAIPSNAIEALERALVMNPNYLEARFLKARLDLERQEPELVVKSMLELLEKAPDFRQAQILLAQAWRMLGRLDAAAALFESAIERNPDDFHAHLLLGLFRRYQGRAEEARTAFEKASRLDIESIRPSFELAELDVIANLPAEAVARVEAVLAKEPNLAEPYYMLGRIHFHQKSWDLAEQVLLKAVELDKNLMGAYGLLIATYIEARKLPDAREQLEQHVAKNPEDALSLLKLALVLEELGDLREAEKAYQRAIKAAPDFAPALNSLAWLYVEKLDEPAKALEIAQEARSLLPGNGEIADTLGWLYYKQKDFARAADLLSEAVSKSPANPEIHYHLGMAAYMMGQIPEARNALATAAKAETDAAWKTTAQDYLSLLPVGDAAPPLADLEAAVAKNPDDVVSLLQLAAVREKRSENDEARQLYEKVREINPQNLEAVIGLAQLYLGALSDPSRAAELAKEARTLDRADGRPLMVLGSIALAEKRAKDAHALLGQAREAGIKDATTLYAHASAAYQIGSVEEARETLQEVLDREAKPELATATREFLALTAPGLKPTPEVLERAETMLAGDPDYLPALMIKGVKALADDDLSGARKIYTSVLSKDADFSPAKLELARVLVAEGEGLEQARTLLLQVKQNRPGDRAISRLLGEVSCRLGDHRYAVQLLQEVDRAQELDAEGLYYLGMAQHELKSDNPESAVNLERALKLGLPKALKDKAEGILAETR